MADTSFFKRLDRLFSSNVVVRRIGKDRIRVVDTNHLQSTGNTNNSRYIDRYGRLHGGRAAMAAYNSNFNYHASKIDLYGDYETMDMDSIIASALDVYADESTTKTENGELLVIRSSDENTRKVLYNLFYDVLNIEFNLWPWVRNLCKYGDFYLYLEIQEGIGVVNVTPLSSYEIERIEGLDPNNPQRVIFMHNGSSGKAQYDNYEIAHFRLLSDSNFLPYGKSMLEGARKVWKQLVLMEDAMLIHRIMRAPEKRIFKIDVGNLPPHEVDQHIQNVINQMKKVPFVDPTTGDYNLKYNIQNLIEDFYMPVRGAQTGTEITNLPGMEYQAIDDIKYLKDKMLAHLKIPKAFLGFEEGVDGKATLAAQDIRFARTIERIQRIILSELNKIAMIHLAAQGHENSELINFDIDLTSPSIVYEQEKIQLLQSKATLVRDLKELQMLSEEWIYKSIWNLSEDEYQKEQLGVIEDTKQKFRRSQIENEGNDPAKTGQSYGTAHDIASLHRTSPGEKSYIDKTFDTPQEEEEWMKNVGAPKKGQTYGTHKSGFGRDPLGKENSVNFPKGTASPIRHTYRGGSALSLENKTMLQSLKGKLYKTEKSKILNESLKTETKVRDIGTMLDENNLIDDENL